MSKECKDLTIILPTLNEGPNLQELLSTITTAYPESAVIVSDDGSKDTTKEVASSFKDSNVFFLDRRDAQVHGLTTSVLDAIRAVNTEYFVVMDADSQHPSDKIEELINQLRLGANIVIGSRIKVSGDWPWQRKLLSYLGTGLGKVSLILRGRFYLNYDILSGFFGAETSFWKQAAFANGNINKFRQKGYKILFDFLKIIPNGARVGKVPYEFGVRKKASSKINFKINLEYLKSCLT